MEEDTQSTTAKPESDAQTGATAATIAEKIPDPYVLISIIIGIAAISTHLIPAGEYKRRMVGTREVIVPGSFHYIQEPPVSLVGALQSIQLGLIDAASIVFFVLIIGGAFGVITATGSITAALSEIVTRVETSDREYLVVVFVPLFFGLLGGVAGLYESTIPFVPLAILLALSLGYDAVVGCSMVLLGLAAGFAAAPLNPFTVGVAQGIAGLPLYSGLWYRSIFWVISMTVTILYIYRYASKVKVDPSKSYVSDIDYSSFELDSDPTEIAFERIQAVILGVFTFTILLLIVGVTQYGWYINEIATLFLVTGAVIGLLYGMNTDQIVSNFIGGAKDLLYAALIIGFARGIIVVLKDGAVLDTLIWTLVQPLKDMSPVVSAALMVPMMSIVNFFIPSGSGQAAVITPILAPIGEIVGIPVQVVVLAFQYGDGFSNMFIPTLGPTMAMITIADIPYGRWLRFTWKLLVLQTLIGMSAVAIGVAINLGPF
ncbi:YfcC family protein [Haladaptatus caseinilyticus]|uniref:YfcC family protein n=1 Tax=Haladaptatus caseinilyticus TaxID=2993314 RepID=UPI00224B4805|nr:TIGR00366 family protein [Haladaptatus caseinilyticus]